MPASMTRAYHRRIGAKSRHYDQSIHVRTMFVALPAHVLVDALVMHSQCNMTSFVGCAKSYTDQPELHHRFNSAHSIAF